MARLFRGVLTEGNPSKKSSKGRKSAEKSRGNHRLTPPNFRKQGKTSKKGVEAERGTVQYSKCSVGGDVEGTRRNTGKHRHHNRIIDPALQGREDVVGKSCGHRGFRDY